LLSAADELDSTGQHFPLNLIKRDSPILVVVRVLARFGRTPLNLRSPCSFDVFLDIIEARKQLRSNLRAVVGLKPKGVFEYLSGTGRHTSIVSREPYCFNIYLTAN
jgi:hypothetical protein